MLDELGFTPNCIVETILVTRDASGNLNPAPIGVRRIGEDLLEVAPFLSSVTYKNLKHDSYASINLTQSPLLFYATAFKDEVKKQPSINKEMIIENADAAIYTEVLSELKMTDLRAYFTLKSKSIQILKRLPSVYSRGRYASIEAIIHATRVKAFRSEGMSEKADRKEEEFRASTETVRRVSSKDSEEALVIESLSKLMRRWR
jgi:hypothetical protein